MAVQLAVIGGGNMAQAIVFGALDAGLTTPDRIAVCEPDLAKRGLFEEREVFSGSSHEGVLSKLAAAGQVLLAVKPQMLGEVGQQLRSHVKAGTVVITILAGTPSEKVREALGGRVRVVRAMPNTAARVKQAITAVCAGAGAASADCELAERLFEGLGKVCRIDEALMDAFTALCGSGPAYVFYLAEAMVRAAIEMGFDATLADEVVRQTVLGAGVLLRTTPQQAAAELRSAVTSKGGTTEAAVGVLDAEGVMRAVMNAILRGRDRGRELAG